MNKLTIGLRRVRQAVARLWLPALAVLVAACAGTPATPPQASATTAPTSAPVAAAPATAAPAGKATEAPLVQVSPVAGTPAPKATLVQPKDGLPAKGAKEAPVKIFEFSDFQ